mmetsp:Transcript_20752/g.23078  ORF Transcript_20752/g.23078 Transcript_20752/m.23078 type:complete len:283 (+) Transcript_20752:274-1122(+)
MGNKSSPHKKLKQVPKDASFSEEFQTPKVSIALVKTSPDAGFPLPLEVVVRILVMLPVNDVVLSVARVNKFCYTCSLSGALWKPAYFTLLNGGVHVTAIPNMPGNYDGKWRFNVQHVIAYDCTLADEKGDDIWRAIYKSRRAEIFEKSVALLKYAATTDKVKAIVKVKKCPHPFTQIFFDQKDVQSKDVVEGGEIIEVVHPHGIIWCHRCGMWMEMRTAKYIEYTPVDLSHTQSKRYTGSKSKLTAEQIRAKKLKHKQEHEAKKPEIVSAKWKMYRRPPPKR